MGQARPDHRSNRLSSFCAAVCDDHPLAAAGEPPFIASNEEARAYSLEACDEEMAAQQQWLMTRMKAAAAQALLVAAEGPAAVSNGTRWL